MKTDHDAEMKKLDIQTKEKLTEIDVNFGKEKIKRQNAFNDQLRDLDAKLFGETDMLNGWYTVQTNLLQAYIDHWKEMNNVPGSNLPGYDVKGGKATGGMVSEGVWYLHDNERVLNAQEAAVWNSLMQGKVPPSLGRSITVQQNFTFKGTFTEGDKRWFSRVAREQAYNAVGEVVDAL
jgi:hypothetical protein